ncbi:unnamed protein product [Calypogeia fissa]
MAGLISGSMLMGRMVSLTRSAAAMRGPEIVENRIVTIAVFGQNQARIRTPTVFSSSSRAFLHSHTRVARFDPTITGAAMVANSALFRRSAQLERHLNPRPWDARRCFSVNPTAVGGGSPLPGPILFIIQLIEKIFQLLAAMLPSRAFIQRVEADVDAAAAMVEGGAKLVSEIADKVEELANVAELGAAEVGKIAQKVEELTEEVKKTVDDVADVLDGDKSVSTLVGSVEQLKNVAAAKRAHENHLHAAENTTTVVSDEKFEATMPMATPEEKKKV